MFSSEAYGGGTVLFSASSTMFLGTDSEEPQKWMGDLYYNTMRAMDCKTEGNYLPVSLSVYLSIYNVTILLFFTTHPDVLRWCVLSSGEERKCTAMRDAFQSQSLTPAIQCVTGESVTDCMKKIKVTAAFIHSSIHSEFQGSPEG